MASLCHSFVKLLVSLLKFVKIHDIVKLLQNTVFIKKHKNKHIIFIFFVAY